MRNFFVKQGSPIQAHKPDARLGQRGVTLIELMVALVLGLLVVLTASAAFIASKQLFNADSETQGLQDSNRFASYIIKTVIRQAGYTDLTPDAVKADGTVNIVSTFSMPQGNPSDPQNLDLVGAANVASSSVDSSTGYGTNDSDTTASASDSLLVRFFGRANWENGKAGEADGTIINCIGLPQSPPGATPSMTDRTWNLFYVAMGPANEPELNCKYRTDTGTFKTESIVRGVEVFKVMYGYDIDNNGTPNKWLNAKQIAAQTLTAGTDSCMPSSCTANDKWRKVVAVRVGMILRSAKDNTTQKQMGDASAYRLYPLGPEFSAVSFAPPDDGRIRKVVTFTVAVRNILKAPT
jgi:type IV pilus assembly protein PilW